MGQNNVVLCNTIMWYSILCSSCWIHHAPPSWPYRAASSLRRCTMSSASCQVGHRQRRALSVGRKNVIHTDWEKTHRPSGCVREYQNCGLRLTDRSTNNIEKLFTLQGDLLISHSRLAFKVGCNVEHAQSGWGRYGSKIGTE